MKLIAAMPVTKAMSFAMESELNVLNVTQKFNSIVGMENASRRSMPAMATETV
jgi:hypothetical protein